MLTLVNNYQHTVLCFLVKATFDFE